MRRSESSPGPSPRFAGTALLYAAAIVLLALSLRSGISSLSVTLPDISDDLGFSPAGVGVLTTLPPLCFAIVGLGTGRLVLRYGVHRVTVVLLAAIVIGLLARASTGQAWVFLLATAVAMAGVAVGNVVLPPLTKQHFPRRVALVSSLYGASLMGGATLASAVTVPVADAFGGWRVGLACWAVVPALAMVLWLPTVRRHERAPAEGAPAPRTVTFGEIARTRLGVAFVLCFAAQSSQAYIQFGWWGSMLTEAGADEAHAGVLLGILTGCGIPMTLALPTLIRLTRGTAALPILFLVVTLVGWTGILVAPLAAGGVAWAVLLGIGGSAFTWVLAMLAHRTRSAGASAQLSALTQGVGYLLASGATFAAGLLHEATGSWDAAVVMALALAVVIGVAGSVIARGAPIEDSLVHR